VASRERRDRAKGSRLGVGLTVRSEPAPAGSAALRVRTTCAERGGPTLDWAWDLDQIPLGREGESIAGQRVARMMARMRRLGCRCQLDLSDLYVVMQALAIEQR
jgi:hypothetical protein